MLVTATVAEFVREPSETFLDGFTKKQLVQIAGHYAIVVDERRRKDDIKEVILVALCEWGVVGQGEVLLEVAVSRGPVSASGSELTFHDDSLDDSAAGAGEA